jgi:translation initiation factor 5B
VLRASEIFEEFSGKKIQLNDGVLAPPRKELFLYSLTDFGIMPKKAGFVWKLKSPETLVKIQAGKDVIITTKEHPFLVWNGKVFFEQSSNLKKNDILISPRSLIKIKNVEEIPTDCKYVYDFSIPNTKNFVAGGFIVHNTTLLDKIRGSAVAEREAGGITQHIGATEIPLPVIEGICGGLIKQLKIKITLPGLLFIDTPGHEAFITLRKRGGALADIAILVVDLTEGFQPQTFEALNILRANKTPFVMAANKIDKIRGWQIFERYPFTHTFSKQSKGVRSYLEEKVYELVGKLYEEGFRSERYDRVEKFEKQIAIVPLSAKTGEGLPDLLMILVGLAQKFLENRLKIAKGPTKGTILEVKEEIGLGKTIDVIIYDGEIKKGDTIAVGGKKGVILTKVRSLLKPRPLDEIRDTRLKFQVIQKAGAAAGVKIAAPNLKDSRAGSPIRVVEENANEIIQEIKAEMEEVKVETETIGVVVKADTLGSVEALAKMLEDKKIPMRLADVGDISRRDIIEAETAKEKAPIRAVVLGFNVKMLKDAQERAKESGIKIFQNNVIYELVENYVDWVREEMEKERRKELEKISMPAKIKILPKHVFRKSKPAIVGIEVLAGKIRSGYRLMDVKGNPIGVVKGVQDKGVNIAQAERGRRVAIAIDGPTVGRQIDEGDSLYIDIPENEVRLIETKYKDILSVEEAGVLEEIKKIKGAECKN